MSKLYKALKTIKKECKKHDSCVYCNLFSENDECLFELNDLPADWRIKQFKNMEDD